MRQGRTAEALALAGRQHARGLALRNGLLVVSAGLLAMDAHLVDGDEAAAAATRARAGAAAHHLGAGAALTALARWRA